MNMRSQNKLGKIMKIFVHLKIQWRSVLTRRQVEGKCRGDELQRQIALCVLENLCKNRCLCNRILSPQKLAQIVWFLIFCDLLQATKFYCGDRFLQKSCSTHEAICLRNVMLQLVAWSVQTQWLSDLSTRRVAATCRLHETRAPNGNFRKISVRKTIWDLEFSEHLL